MSNEIILTIVSTIGGGGIVGAILTYLSTREKEKTASYQSLLNDYQEDVERKKKEIEDLNQKLNEVKDNLEQSEVQLQIANSSYLNELVEIERKFMLELSKLRNKIQSN